MDSDTLFYCDICFNKYNTSDHLPMIIPQCGHHLCSSCIQQILDKMIITDDFTCPFCQTTFQPQKKDLSSFLKNFSLIGVLGQQLPGDLCPKHNKKLDLVDVDICQKICTDCAIFGDNKGHQLVKIDEAATKSNERAKKFGELINRIDKSKAEFSKENIRKALEEKEKQLMTMVEDQFGQVIEMIFNRKEEITNEIVSHFLPLKEACSSNAVDPKLEQEVFIWRDHAKKMIERWKNSVEDISFDLLQEKDDMVSSVEAFINQNSILKDVEAQAKKVSLRFDPGFPGALKQFCKWKDFEGENLMATIGDGFQVMMNDGSEQKSMDNLKQSANLKETPAIQAERKKSSSNSEVKSSKKEIEFKGDFRDQVAFVNAKVNPCFQVDWDNKDDIILKKGFDGDMQDLYRTKGLMIRNWYEKSGAFALIKNATIYLDEATAPYMCEGLYKLTNIRYLHLDFFNAKKIDDETFIAITKQISRLTTLNKLIISAKEMTKISDTSIAYLCQAIASLPQIVHLTIDLFGCKNLGDHIFKYIEDEFPKMANLRILSLTFGTSATVFKNTKLTDLGFFSLAKCIMNLTKLKSFSIDCQGLSKITDHSMLEFASAISCLKEISHLNLEFEGCGKITDTTIQSVASKLLGLSELTYLTLDFRGCKVSNVGVSSVADVVVKIPKLKNLNLDFKCDKVDSKGKQILNELASKSSQYRIQY